MKIFFGVFWKGFAMGIAEVIPGVSGSTVALVLGIYEDFIDLLHSFSDVVKTKLKWIFGRAKFADVIKSIKDIHWKFGVALIFGMLLAIGSFSHIISYYLENERQYIFGVFFGLVVVSVFIPFSRISKKNLSSMGILILSFFIFLWIFSQNALAPSTDPSLIYLFLGAVLGISAMMLPGISGSFVLLLLGIYDYVIGLIKDLTQFQLEITDLIKLIVFFLGLVFGFVVFARILKVALNKYENILMASLTGLMMASLRVLWPFVDKEQNLLLPWQSGVEGNVLLTVVLIATGIITVEILRRVSEKKD